MANAAPHFRNGTVNRENTIKQILQNKEKQNKKPAISETREEITAQGCFPFDTKYPLC